jgi:hypothetical protein
MTQSERDTYLPIRELIDRAIEYATAIVHRLEELRGESKDSRVALLQQALRDEQLNLTTAIQRYAEQAPDDVMDTVAQYSIALPDRLLPLGTPHTPADLEQWALDVNRRLGDFFSELAEVAEETPAREPLANLAERVKSHEKRIVQAFAGAQEL